MLRSRILTGLVVAAFAGIVGSQLASCTLDQEGGTEVDTGKACTIDANCEDNNPCTTDTCPKDTLVCQYAKQASGAAPDSAQTPNDCKSIECNAGTPSTQDDLQDFVNDNNSCTVDACTNGVPTNVPMANGSPCMVGTKSGTCDAGKCTVSCANDKDCDDGNRCSDDICNTGSSTCTFTFLDGVPTPGFTQVPGDCKVQFCDAGMDKQLNDDADLPDDGNSCTADVCTAGVPTNPAVSPSTPCMLGDVNVCDGNGACVECVVPADCVTITETECEKRDCVNNKCQIAYEGQTTLASPVLQTAKDCKKVVCNGANGTTTVNDDADLPDDSNPCTTDTCASGMAVFTNNAQGTTCGNNQVCNATGGCVGCNSPMDCMGTDDFCKTRTCVSNVCGVSFTANGTDLPAANQTSGDCKVLECDGAGSVKSSVLTSDVPVDMNDCTLNVCSPGGQPSNPNSPLNASCSSNGGDVCNGAGVCKKSNSKPCSAMGECLSALCVDGYCCNSACTTDCQSCNVAGSIGTCSDVPKGQDDGACTGATVSCNVNHDCDRENGQGCMASTSCLSGFCADGVCCNEACGATCKACNLMATNGTCSNLPAGSQDNNATMTCSGMNQCDGTGTCKKSNGAACAAATECLSGNCVDSVCCSTASCTGDCKACNVNGMGTCADVPTGMDHGACTGATKSCDGAGVCKLENGTTCAMASECFSNMCVDTVCCNSTCTGTCKSCNVSGMAGTCSNAPAGADPDNECAMQSASTCGTTGSCNGSGACALYDATTECAAPSCMNGVQQNQDKCNGMGMCVDGGTAMCTPYVCGATACKTSCAVDGDCIMADYCAAPNCIPKKADGQMCTMANQCTSGFCIDGVCCSTACLGTCKGCGVMGSVGTCVNLPLNTDDTNSTMTCTGMKTCNGVGQCLNKIGESCQNKNDCASDNCSGGTCAP